MDNMVPVESAAALRYWGNFANKVANLEDGTQLHFSPADIESLKCAKWSGVGLELVSCGEFAEFLVAGEAGSEDEEGEEVLGFAFVAQREAAVSREPGHRSFDHSAVLAEFVLGFDAYRVFGSEDPNLSDAAQWGVTRNGGSVDGASCASAPMIGWYKKGTSPPE